MGNLKKVLHCSGRAGCGMVRECRLRDEKRGMLWVERVGDRRSWGILAQNFSLETTVR
jgi:hypothetical protein